MGQAETLKELFSSMFKVFTDVKFAESMAKMYYNFYIALVKEGFTKEEAIQIITSMKFTS